MIFNNFTFLFQILLNFQLTGQSRLKFLVCILQKSILEYSLFSYIPPLKKIAAFLLK